MAENANMLREDRGADVYFGRFNGKKNASVAEGHLGDVSCAALLWGHPFDNSHQGSQMSDAEHGVDALGLLSCAIHGRGL